MVKSDTTPTMPVDITMSLREKLNSPFPYYLNDDRKNLLLISVITVFVIAFMYLFKTPNDLDLSFNHHLLFGGITFVCLIINIIFFPKFFPVWFDATTWNLKKYIVLNIWHLLLIGMASSAVDILYICPEKPFWENVLEAHGRVVLKGAIPIALITLFLRNIMLQQNLKTAIIANKELSKIESLKKEIPKTNNAITIFTDTSETLTFNLPELLFIEADDNYSTVFWKNGHGIEKKLLRANLKNVENQLNNSFTIRCHRSYIVNVHAISTITGNTNGYKLQIRDSDFSIPVSRPKGKELMEKISQLRNMMELY